MIDYATFTNLNLLSYLYPSLNTLSREKVVLLSFLDIYSKLSGEATCILCCKGIESGDKSPFLLGNYAFGESSVELIWVFLVEKRLDVAISMVLGLNLGIVFTSVFEIS